MSNSLEAQKNKLRKNNFAKRNFIDIRRTQIASTTKRVKKWHEKLYDRVTIVVKYVGIPGLIIAAIGPVQKLSNDVIEHQNRKLIQKVYLDYVSSLMKEGSIERANKLLATMETQKDFDARLQYYKSKALIAMAIQQAKNYAEALDTASILSEIAIQKAFYFPTIAETDDLIELNLSIADIEIAQQRYGEAKEKIKRVEDNKLFVKSSLLAPSVNYRYGTIDVLQYKTESAIDNLRKSIDLSDKIGQKLLAANATFQLAKAYQFSSSFEEALKLYDNAISRFEDLQDKFGLLRCYNNKAMIYFNNAQNDKAREFYNKEQIIAREVGDELGYARAVLNLGTIEKREGNYSGGIRSGLDALGVFRQQKNILGIGSAANLLANIYSIQGNYSEAIAYSKEHFSSSLQLRELRGVLSACGTLSNIYANIKDDEETLYSSICSVSLIVHMKIQSLPYSQEDYAIFENRIKNIVKGKRDAQSRVQKSINRVRDIFTALNINPNEIGPLLNEITK